MVKSNFDVLVDREQFILLMDLGPWDKFRTITNDAENVVKEMAQRGLGDRKLFYVDSEGGITQLIHDGGGVFITFADSMSLWEGEGH